MQISEPATQENFDAYRYLLANRDLRIAFGDDEAMAGRHFHEHGLKENRHQLTAAFLSSQEFEGYLRMTPEIRVFERATTQNFNAPGYLLANRDLRIAFGDDEAMAERHLHEFGLKENRIQVSKAFLSSRHAKFARFKGTLPECNAQCFPVNFGQSPYDISEYSSESSNHPLGFWIAELDSNVNKLYADIGAGLRRVVMPNCVYVEVYPSLTTDVLINPDCKLPFKDSSLDGIGCFAVLEHINEPWEMAVEFSRVVKPGGKIFIDWPFLQPVHGYPSHYYNATREGLRFLFSDKFKIDELDTGAWQGPDYTVNWVLNSLLSRIKDDSIRTQLSQTTVEDLCNQPPQSEMWKAILRTLDDNAISMLACGNFLIGTRK